MSAMRVCILFLAAATLQGCAQSEDFDDAEQSVTMFHDRMNRGLYEEIWELTAPVFGDRQSRDEIRTVFSVMHSHLGKVLESEQIDASSYSSSTEGTTVTLAYHTTFERGSGTETFIFMVDSGAPLMVNYNINSEELIGIDFTDYQKLAESAL